MNFGTLLILFVFFSPIAQAQSGLLDIKSLIPPEYESIPTMDLGQLFADWKGSSQAIAEAQCLRGAKIGDQVGRALVKRLNPSCDELLLPLGSGENNEWAVPDISFQDSEDPAIVCHYHAYAAAFETTIRNTALNCAKIFNDTLTLAVQIEYNRCYAATAHALVHLDLAFAHGSGFITGDYVLIPRESAAWDRFVAALVSIVNSDGQEQKSAFLVQSCRLGTVHAQRRQPPISFL